MLYLYHDKKGIPSQRCKTVYKKIDLVTSRDLNETIPFVAAQRLLRSAAKIYDA